MGSHQTSPDMSWQSPMKPKRYSTSPTNEPLPWGKDVLSTKDEYRLVECPLTQAAASRALRL